jgi:hypothetical protein
MKIKIQIYAIIIVMMCFKTPSIAQQQTQDLLRGGAADANTLVQDYMAPFGKSFGAALNEGWYNTAKTHSFPFFDATLYWNWALVPTMDDNFTIPYLNHLQSANPANTTSPTIAGGTNNGPTMNVIVENPLTGRDTVITHFQMPGGLNLKLMSLPIAQLTVGLLHGTDVSIRYMPQYNIPGSIDAKVNLWGIGLKHDIKQYIPFLSAVPIDISIQAGYTSFTSSADLDLQPDAGAIQTGAIYNNQKIEFDVNSFTANLIISKKLPMFTFYGSVGYETSSSKLNVLGTYPVTILNNSGQAQIMDITDPVKLNFSGVQGIKANLGIRYRFTILTLHADYTVSQYSGISTGLGVDIDLK